VDSSVTLDGEVIADGGEGLVMRAYYQPAQASPSEWVSFDSVDWGGLGSFKVNALNIQGLVFEGPDFYSVEDLGNGQVRVIVWHSDPKDWPVGSRWAREVLIRPLGSDPRPEFGGAINTHFTQVLYAEAAIKPILEAAYQGNSRVLVKGWTDFDPNRVAPREGKWLSDALYSAMQDKRSLRGWREWTDGLDPSEVGSDGKVRPQRPAGNWVLPKGTRTYYHNDVDLATTAHIAEYEHALEILPAGSSNVGSGNIGTPGATVFACSSPVNEPDSDAWPNVGLYRRQLDIIQIGVDLTLGCLDQGNGDGHFARVSGDLSTDLQSFQQSEAAFFGAGLHLASITDPAWSAGTSTDRFETLIASVRIIGHGTQTFTLQAGEFDDFTDGPWAAAAGGQNDDPIFFGTNF